MRLTDEYIVLPHTKVRLSDHDPGRTIGVDDKEDAHERLEENRERLAQLQYMLYAESKKALLVILQAMDAGGKDGVIRHVMTGMNPQQCRVTSFKEPTPDELAHDFLWRIHKRVPRRGEVGVFNRSHYEDVLVVRVHGLAPESVWRGRYEQINAFEKMLAENDVRILKFYLHISKEEQKERLLDRIKTPHKNWKVNEGDFTKRKYWDDYMRAYEEAIGRCSTEWAPWFIIPANKKWYRNVAVSRILIETLEDMKVKFPPPMPGLSEITID